MAKFCGVTENIRRSVAFHRKFRTPEIKEKLFFIAYDIHSSICKFILCAFANLSIYVYEFEDFEVVEFRIFFPTNLCFVAG